MTDVAQTCMIAGCSASPTHDVTLSGTAVSGDRVLAPNLTVTQTWFLCADHDYEDLVQAGILREQRLTDE